MFAMMRALWILNIRERPSVHTYVICFRGRLIGRVALLCIALSSVFWEINTLMWLERFFLGIPKVGGGMMTGALLIPSVDFQVRFATLRQLITESHLGTTWQ